jgi:hypothetical protein
MISTCRAFRRVAKRKATDLIVRSTTPTGTGWQLNRLRKKQSILSFRAKRGISLRFGPTKKREIPRFARNDKILEEFFPQLVKPRPTNICTYQKFFQSCGNRKTITRIVCETRRNAFSNRQFPTAGFPLAPPGARSVRCCSRRLASQFPPLLNPATAIPRRR